jgi:deoxyribose-phosphate aldolase
MNIAQYIDHTLLKATASAEEIQTLCQEAIDHQFYAVCVNGSYVKLAKSILGKTSVKIAAVVGFPLGQSTTASKVFEAKEAIANGADEIDMVLNIADLKAGKTDAVRTEIASIKDAIGKNILKVIFENCYLTDAEIKLACDLSLQAGADFVKTSTGFGTHGATVEHVKIMLDAVKDKAQVKAAGGVRNFEDAQKYIDMGVTRLGTSSGVQILQGKTITGY